MNNDVAKELPMKCDCLHGWPFVLSFIDKTFNALMVEIKEEEENSLNYSFHMSSTYSISPNTWSNVNLPMSII